VPTLDTVTDRPDVTDETRYVGGYPYADFDALRDQDPVQWYRRPGFEPFWAVTGLAEVAHVSRHPELFSSAQRVTLDPPDAIEMIEADIDGRAAMFGHDRNDAPALSYMDAPRHRELRRVMAPFFSVRAVAALEERFVGLARGYADDFRATLAADGTADVATGLTNRLPVAAICEMVGVPEGDREDVLAWTEGLVGCADPEQQLPGEDAAATFQRNMMALGGYLAEHVRVRMEQQGGDDMIAALVSAEVEGRPLAYHEVLYTVQNLLVAGNGTTRNAMAAGVRALLEHPDQLAALAQDDSLLDGAVEEILRWSTIAVHFARTCVADTELGGRTIRAGETLVLWYPGANRDPLAFDDPHRFDITRTVNPHVAFGGNGAHVCLGQHLARLEIRATLRAIVPLLLELEPVGVPESLVLHLQVAELKKVLVRAKEVAA
jgi:cholest-4-en-3-one 26-monooxygenase